MADPIGYQIQVEGWLGDRWAHWFADVTVRAERAHDGSPITVLSGTFDQAALRGTLIKLWDLNLTLLCVKRIESRGEKSDGKPDQIL